MAVTRSRRATHDGRRRARRISRRDDHDPTVTRQRPATPFLAPCCDASSRQHQARSRSGSVTSSRLSHQMLMRHVIPTLQARSRSGSATTACRGPPAVAARRRARKRERRRRRRRAAWSSDVLRSRRARTTSGYSPCGRRPLPPPPRPPRFGRDVLTRRRHGVVIAPGQEALAARRPRVLDLRRRRSAPGREGAARRRRRRRLGRRGERVRAAFFSQGATIHGGGGSP